LTVTGTLTLRPLAPGSHSERVGPVLVDDDGAEYPLHLVGESPFEEPTLSALEGRRLTVTGSWRNGVVRIAPDGIEVAP
jgi:hypothetical protein